jgi:hypothetical protein
VLCHDTNELNSESISFLGDFSQITNINTGKPEPLKSGEDVISQEYKIYAKYQNPKDSSKWYRYQKRNYEKNYPIKI